MSDFFGDCNCFFIRSIRCNCISRECDGKRGKKIEKRTFFLFFTKNHSWQELEGEDVGCVWGRWAARQLRMKGASIFLWMDGFDWGDRDEGNGVLRCGSLLRDNFCMGEREGEYWLCVQRVTDPCFSVWSSETKGCYVLKTIVNPW